MLILQCDSGDRNAELIACARHIIWDEYKQAEMEKSLSECRSKAHVILVIQLPRISGGCFMGFQVSGRIFDPRIMWSLYPTKSGLNLNV